ncbi:hypothetical protein [Streptomyces nanshensis]|uniref:hypothetical protein n=1 Tax=Streptomyces nanshensis TaxID=518642 RepID=UPI001FD2424A|nr:hypothetical protein [Streptomyces nanshensis]
MSYYRISEACEMKAERAGKIARGEATVTALETIERIADGMRIPGSLLGLAARAWEEPAQDSSPAHEFGDDPMKRRELLRGALAAGLTGKAMIGLADTRNHFERSLASTAPANLPDLESAAETYSYGYAGRAPADLLGELAADFDEIGDLLTRPLSTTARTRLCRVAGQMAGMTAVVLHDLGDRREARNWFHTAGQAATESGDRSLRAWIYAREAMVPLNFGAPRQAAELAENARRAAGTAQTASAALAASVAARAHALAGDREGARQALTEAEKLSDSLPAAERADTWFGLPEQKQHVHRSHALTILGKTKEARQSQTRALELTAPTSTMTRGLLRIDAAVCEHRDGDTAQACRMAVAALHDLPTGWRTGLTRTRAVDLYRSIPAQYHREPAARELRDVLAARP